MPLSPPRACTSCGRVHYGPCTDSRKTRDARYDERRGSAHSRGYGTRWRKYRKMFLQANPLCVECKRQGRIMPATDVDHIKPVDGPDDELFWKPSNHQALCHSCHSVKTRRENDESKRD